ncbi:MAG TPA: NADH-quinone oxidoreductase subunit L [Candidatus Sulfotelmatobacter sp.]|nr:NADH-quinone oxidoreductase subunit L [Candidatus Sulfotelmatobacter sp.]
MYAAIVFLPLAGAIIAGLFGRLIGDRASQLVTCGAMALAAALGIVLFVDVALGGANRTVDLSNWISSGSFEVAWALRFDTLSAVMVSMVALVSACIHVYSIGYMSHDPSIPRFMSYLSLFTFSMLMLVTSDNFVQLFFGWEGVGLCSYLLIGFWYDRPSANAAAIKAFVVNRIGDFSFALGIFFVFKLYDAVGFDTVFAATPEKVNIYDHFLGYDVHALTAVCILLFIGAMGKSAQIGLHTWLPDAMEGPTPVSALIHAATMVTAGVFMVCRLSPMFEFAPDALAVVTVVGATTAIFAATIGLVQPDIKRVIAYSTCSQLGYMFFAAGVSAYGAAMFHLITHAFFKALLFLGSGSVIHAMSGEQDMFKMGGLGRHIKITYVVMWIGSLALGGVPPFAGFWSKDTMLDAALLSGSSVGLYAYWLGVAAAILTAFYSWRLLFLTFHGKPRADHHTMEHVHESPPVMMVPLYILSVGAIVAGGLGFHYFVGEGHTEFWRDSLFVLPEHDVLSKMGGEWPDFIGLPTIVAVIGIVAAYVAYIRLPDLPSRFAATFRTLYLFLLNKWYFDEIYDAVFVRPALFIGRGLWRTGDGAIIDGLGPDGIATTARNLARWVSARQTGYVYHYAFAMLIGVVVIMSWYLYRRIG